MRDPLCSPLVTNPGQHPRPTTFPTSATSIQPTRTYSLPSPRSRSLSLCLFSNLTTVPSPRRTVSPSMQRPFCFVLVPYSVSLHGFPPVCRVSFFCPTPSPKGTQYPCQPSLLHSMYGAHTLPVPVHPPFLLPAGPCSQKLNILAPLAGAVLFFPSLFRRKGQLTAASALDKPPFVCGLESPVATSLIVLLPCLLVSCSWDVVSLFGPLALSCLLACLPAQPLLLRNSSRHQPPPAGPKNPPPNRRRQHLSVSVLFLPAPVTIFPATALRPFSLTLFSETRAHHFPFFSHPPCACHKTSLLSLFS